MSQPIWPEMYYLGLQNIKGAIELSLSSAGARLSVDSISWPKLSKSRGIPNQVTIVAVPLEAPRTALDFTAQEILDCWNAVESSTVHEKIRRYVLEFERFREDAIRFIRPPAYPRDGKHLQ